MAAATIDWRLSLRRAGGAGVDQMSGTDIVYIISSKFIT
jgi:hypothetical protein